MTPRVTVVIPTLHGGPSLEKALRCLEAQTFQDFVAVVVDNGGNLVPESFDDPPRRIVIRNAENVGFGAAINQGLAINQSKFICTLNDDAYPEPECLAELVGAAESNNVGMCAAQIRLANRPGRLDSAGLSIYPDGTTKQRGHGEIANSLDGVVDALLPSGCAALYGRTMLDEVGAFDPDYFLYCEDTDLGLRGRLAGWSCRYVPSAVVTHEYSRSTGRASQLKAFFVERNRLRTIVKTFPALSLVLAPAFSLWRYFAHGLAMIRGQGLAAEYRHSGASESLAMVVARAHWHVFRELPKLLTQRRAVRVRSTLGSLEFIRLLRRHSVSAWKIATQ